ncbi:MAG: hypothetical protein HY455_01780 [Parcubacteria group bacterium]|nr:hypothetical protein [Parcubacteria group bacterium]
MRSWQLGAKLVASVIFIIAALLAYINGLLVGTLVFSGLWVIVGTGSLRESLIKGDKRLLRMTASQSLKTFARAAFYGPFVHQRVMAKL